MTKVKADMILRVERPIRARKFSARELSDVEVLFGRLEQKEFLVGIDMYSPDKFGMVGSSINGEIDVSDVMNSWTLRGVPDILSRQIYRKLPNDIYGRVVWPKFMPYSFIKGMEESISYDMDFEEEGLCIEITPRQMKYYPLGPPFESAINAFKYN